MSRIAERRVGMAGTGSAALVVLLGMAAADLPAQDRLPAGQSVRVDAVFAEYDRTDSPGCALGITRNGQLVYARGYGMANLEHGVPIGPGSVFHMASVSKQFAAFAVVLLAERGRLSLDDDIRVHLPEMHDFGETITIRHLVHHTSGLRDQWNLLSLGGWRGGDIKTQQDVLDLAFAQRELNFPPGEEYMYSNTGYTLLAEIVRRVDGRSLRAFADAEIFGPLGMHDTHFHDDYNMIVPNRTHGYSPAGGGLRVSNPAYSLMGATSLFTTVEDMARWDRNFYDKSVGGALAWATMHERGRLRDGSDIDYAFALTHGRHRGQRTVGHGGADAGYRTQFLRFPDQGTSFTVLCNLSTSNPGRLAREVADVVLADVLAEPESGGGGGAGGGPRQAAEPYMPSDRELLDLVGRYHSVELDYDYHVVVAGEGLVLRRRRLGDTRLAPTGPDAFQAGGLRVTFERDAAGRPTELVVTTGRVRNLRFTRRD